MPVSRKARLASDFKVTPYWWEAAAPEVALDELPTQVDVVVIGSGYCGLAAAGELARQGRQVAVVDSQEIGAGASTRSGGMVSSGQKLVVAGAVKGLGSDQIARLLSESLESFTYLKTLIEDHRLDADLQLNGRFFGAYTAAHFERLQRQGQLLREKTGVTVHCIPRERQRTILGSDYYHGGIVVDEYGGLHVGKYHRALRDLARQSGAGLYSHAPVEGIGASGTDKLVCTARGRIRCRHVIIATNGYSGGAAPYVQRRVVPVASYQIATAPLPAGLMDRLIPGRRMVSDSQRNLYYLRPSPDGTRLLFGSRPVIFDTSEEQAAHRLHDALVTVFPELEDVAVSHAWKGFVGMTLDKRAHIGAQDGVHHAVGCNGNGVALMTYLGYRIARELMGLESSRSAFAEGCFPDAPFYQGTPWFVPAATAMYEIGDAWDAYRGRRG